MRLRTLLLVTLCACSASPRTPDAAKSSIAAAKTAGIAVNEVVRVSVVVRDASGQPLGDVNVSGALSGSGGMVTMGPATMVTGEAGFDVSSSTVGTKTLTVKALETTLGEVTLDFVAGPPVGFEFVSQPTTVKAGQVMAPVTLRIIDSMGNTSPAPYSLSLRLVRNTSGATLTGGASRSAVDGGVTFDMLSVNRPQPGYALRAEAFGGAANESVLFDVTAGDPDPGMSTLVAMPASVTVGMMTTLTLTVRDVAGNALSSRMVSWSVSGGGNVLTPSGPATGGNGVVTATLSSSVAETKTVTATIGTVMVTAMVVIAP